ncbi:hypothetical protein M2132_000177 [Dysgonomonas sp. PH5-45]|uniref:hypothetical protein n=1 Tax=unclassified Dysgonomonas TaxID=2630389 RepID=UPI002473E032|nr:MULTISPECIES: hypothetical protein [unclassified Dysgonomonas]MDH6353860.1 hypothetical protein [Dysgonomonas sp. PH5-45]MDH6386762.1 hypothetical protein [Dysgonomonas sp. PH5-37]
MKKRLTFFGIVLFLGISFSACSNAQAVDKEIEHEVEAMNSQMPMVLNSNTRLDSCAYIAKGKICKYYVTLTNLSVEREKMEELSGESKKNSAAFIKQSKEMQTMKDHGVTVEYIYRNSQGETLFDNIITPEDYK